MEIFSNHLRVLADHLQGLLPRSVLAYNWTKLALAGQYPDGNRARCFVDAWPEPQFVCCWVDEPLKAKHVSYRIGTLLNTQAAFQTDNLKRFLHSLAVELADSQCFWHINWGPGENIVQATTEILQPFGTVESPIKDMQTWWIPFHHHPRFHRKIELPSNLKMEKLRETDTDFVFETLPHPYARDKESWKQRALHLLSVCLRDTERNEALCCFALTNPLGYGTHGYTVEEYRGKRLMSKVIQEHQRELAEMDVCPYGFVMDDNMASQKAMLQAGFMVKTPYRVTIFQFDPSYEKTDSKL